MTDDVWRYSVTARARLERLPEPPPGAVERWNERLHGDLAGAVIDPPTGAITLSWETTPGAAGYLVRATPWQQPPVTRWQRLARRLRVARMRLRGWWRS